MSIILSGFRMKLSGNTGIVCMNYRSGEDILVLPKQNKVWGILLVSKRVKLLEKCECLPYAENLIEHARVIYI